MGGSIVNLMSSILKSYGFNSEYKLLKDFDLAGLCESTNIVLAVIDGLGYEYVMDYGKDSIFYEYLKCKITSVFPATTATGITTFATGVAPQQHAITGWFTYLKEFGLVATILPFTPRCGGLSFGQAKMDPKIIFNQKSISEKINVDSYYIIRADLVHSDYTRTARGKARGVPYIGLNEYFERIHQVISSNNNKKYIYAYWPELDSLAHVYGVHSTEVFTHFQELNKGFSSFVESIKGTNTAFIITADHGLIDSTDSRTIKLAEHPDFVETLTLPLCGEPRVAYCYVRPAKVSDFEEYVKKNFMDVCTLHKAEELVEKNYFGLFKAHERLSDRIGDYILIMKENYVMKDFVLGEKIHYFVGNHGGVSKEEMYVPLVVIKK
jgi:predicted AlkP superfamily pyrophosphatase or phosphodiesterase